MKLSDAQLEVLQHMAAGAEVCFEIGRHNRRAYYVREATALPRPKTPRRATIRWLHNRGLIHVFTVDEVQGCRTWFYRITPAGRAALV